MMFRWKIALVCGAAIVAGCSGDEGGTGGDAAASSTSDAVTSTGTSSGETWVNSACGACVHQDCRAAFDACSADPECPAYAACLDACPVGATGDVDPTCEAGCPRGTGTESRRAAAKIDACRDPGPGAKCSACAVSTRDGAAGIEILNQTCPAPPTSEIACIACQEQNCCETYDACLANAECAGYRECIRAAGDYTVECAESFPAGVGLAAEDFLCATYHCAIDQDDCNGALREPCLQCAYTSCTKEYVDFLATGNGFLLGNCVGACPVGDDVCDEACYDQFPGSIDAALAFGECALTACGEEC
jgi:hypothetical protein